MIVQARTEERLSASHPHTPLPHSTGWRHSLVVLLRPLSAVQKTPLARREKRCPQGSRTASISIGISATYSLNKPFVFVLRTGSSSLSSRSTFCHSEAKRRNLFLLVARRFTPFGNAFSSPKSHRPIQSFQASSSRVHCNRARDISVFFRRLFRPRMAQNR